jgi:hypothetical protein
MYFIENTHHFLAVEITLHFSYWYFCELLEANRHFRLEIDPVIVIVVLMVVFWVCVKHKHQDCTVCGTWVGDGWSFC